MNKPTILLLPVASLLFSSCGGYQSENYDTAPSPSYTLPTEIPDTAAPTYEAAAYEENTTIPTEVVEGGTAAPSAPANATSPQGAREHYVAPGDSLWKISNTYKVSIESIKAANQMTNDTVVLGKKLIIPAQ